MTTPKRTGMKKTWKAMKLPALKWRPAFSLFKPWRSDHLLPLKGSVYSFLLRLSTIWTLFSCSRIYFSIVAVFTPTVLTIYLVAQKFVFPYLYFWFARRSDIIIVFFPFRYPINCDTLIFGGFEISRWVWSGILFPDILVWFFDYPFSVHYMLFFSYILA